MLVIYSAATKNCSLLAKLRVRAQPGLSHDILWPLKVKELTAESSRELKRLRWAESVLLQAKRLLHPLYHCP